ncbi:hypothetical protein NEDG_00438 [Nematocida displodere]|uniref:IMS import disulfide relay-system CHCH-CHCH-like Cx9C domain-containing protein n=1 Tax=Nematocida displodere TaxID=1805483 RepID=A0A177EJ16_9MICR|nr:hypothetical protein NEDG_00438 [Nematocida displodere]
MEEKEGCNCTATLDDACKEAYIEAYKCYLKHQNTPTKCLRQITAMKGCYAAAQTKPGLWARIGRWFG